MDRPLSSACFSVTATPLPDSAVKLPSMSVKSITWVRSVGVTASTIWASPSIVPKPPRMLAAVSTSGSARTCSATAGGRAVGPKPDVLTTY